MANKTLVMYFSSTGHTRRAADIIAQKLNADTYEIKAENPYTPADLDWNDPGSRANREQNDGGSRPAYQGELPDISRYDTVIIGHPTWWGDTSPHYRNSDRTHGLHRENSGNLRYLGRLRIQRCAADNGQAAWP